MPAVSTGKAPSTYLLNAAQHLIRGALAGEQCSVDCRLVSRLLGRLAGEEERVRHWPRKFGLKPHATDTHVAVGAARKRIHCPVVASPGDNLVVDGATANPQNAPK